MGWQKPGIFDLRQVTQGFQPELHRGQVHDDLLPGLRKLTPGRATIWFTTDDGAGLIRVLAVFFGALDQHRHMLIRLLERRNAP